MSHPSLASHPSPSSLNVNHYSPIDDGRALEASDETQPHQVEVTLIKPCESQNGLRYSPAVLRAAVPLFEGAAAFADHPDAIDMTRAGGRSIRDLVGVYHSARYENGRGVRAVLRFLPAAAWAYRIVESVLKDRAQGQTTPPVGISADLMVVKQPTGHSNGRRPGYTVLKIEAVNSCDLVFRPAAGGSFDRLLEAITKEDSMPPEPTANPTAEPNADPTPASLASHSSLAVPALEAELTAARQVRLALCEDLLSTRLAASNLPTPAQDTVRKRFTGRVFEASELDAEISTTREMLGQLASAGVIHGMGRGRVQLGRTGFDNFNLALERLFGIPLPDNAKDVPRLSGIREAYILLTGDPEFTGRYDWERSVAREANEVTQAIMDSAVANVMNKRLVMDYRGQPKWWAPLVSVVDIRDMKVQTRILLNDFASLATVAENGAYANLAWGDSAETYTPTKKGNIVYVTMEMIINDDTRSVVRIPSKLAKAATVTINEYIAALWTAGAGLGPAMADTKTVFHADHGANTGVDALAAASLQAAITAIRKHANSASKRLGINPKYLLIPVDLEWTAVTLLNSTLLPGSPNNDVNALHGIVTPIVVPNWTDVNNWYLHPDPREVETIELGFLNGREEPELLVMDNPSVGTVFTNDAISWKVRWIYGAGWLDYRGTFGSVVA